MATTHVDPSSVVVAGNDLLQRLIDCNSKLRRLRDWLDMLAALQMRVHREQDRLNAERRELMTRLQELTEHAPHELGLHPSPKALEWLAQAEDAFSDVHADGESVLREVQ